MGAFHGELHVEPIAGAVAHRFALREHHPEHVLRDVEVEHRHVAERFGQVYAGWEPRPPGLAGGRPDVVGPEAEEQLRAARKIGEGSRPGPPGDVRERGGDGGVVAPLRRGEIHLRRAHHLSDVGVHRVLV